MADSQALLQARFGINLPGIEVPDAVASLIDRRVTRRYTEQDVPDPAVQERIRDQLPDIKMCDYIRGAQS